MDEIETFAVAGLVAPHPLAAAAGRDVLVEGGTMIEAAIAMAAVSAVVVPGRNGLGGDALWLIRDAGPRGRVRVLDGRGTVGAAARLSFYRERGHETVPRHGAEAVAAVPGAVAAWSEAHALSTAKGGRLPLSRLLARPPPRPARAGRWAAPEAAALAALGPALVGGAGLRRDLPGRRQGARGRGNGVPPGPRRHARPPRAVGLDDLYRGDVGRELAVDLADLVEPARARRPPGRGGALARGAEPRHRPAHPDGAADARRALGRRGARPLRRSRGGGLRRLAARRLRALARADREPARGRAAHRRRRGRRPRPRGPARRRAPRPRRAWRSTARAPPRRSRPAPGRSTRPRSGSARWTARVPPCPWCRPSGAPTGRGSSRAGPGSSSATAPPPWRSTPTSAPCCGPGAAPRSARCPR